MDIEKQYLKWSARRYSITVAGELFNSNGEPLKVYLSNDELYVDLEWLLGKRPYKVAILVLVTFGCLDIDHHLLDKVIPQYIDGKKTNVYLSNLSYTFGIQGLPAEGYDGFFILPFFTRYAISIKGVLINRVSGKFLTWLKQPTMRNGNRRGGYLYCRAVDDSGNSRVLLQHRAIASVFLETPAGVENLVVNHKDGIPWNNDPVNLEWVTHLENVLHAIKSGLMSPFGSHVSIPVLVKDLKTGIVTRYPSATACAKALGIWGYDHILNRIRRHSDRVYTDLRQFKFDDGTEWPIINLDEIGLCKTGQGNDIVARNVFTGDYIFFVGTSNGERFTGVKAATIQYHLATNCPIPTNGFNFRYLEDAKYWPNHTEWHLQSYRDYPKDPPDGIVVTDITNGNVNYYTSVKSTAENFKVTTVTIGQWLLSSKPIRDKYRFSKWSLKEHLGHPLEKSK